MAIAHFFLNKYRYFRARNALLVPCSALFCLPCHLIVGILMCLCALLVLPFDILTCGCLCVDQARVYHGPIVFETETTEVAPKMTMQPQQKRGSSTAGTGGETGAYVPPQFSPGQTSPHGYAVVSQPHNMMYQGQYAGFPQQGAVSGGAHGYAVVSQPHQMIYTQQGAPMLMTMPMSPQHQQQGPPGQQFYPQQQQQQYGYSQQHQGYPPHMQQQQQGYPQQQYPQQQYPPQQHHQQFAGSPQTQASPRLSQPNSAGYQPLKEEPGLPAPQPSAVASAPPTTAPGVDPA